MVRWHRGCCDCVRCLHGRESLRFKYSPSRRFFVFYVHATCSMCSICSMCSNYLTAIILLILAILAALLLLCLLLCCCLYCLRRWAYFETIFALLFIHSKLSETWLTRLLKYLAAHFIFFMREWCQNAAVLRFNRAMSNRSRFGPWTKVNIGWNSRGATLDIKFKFICR